MKRLHDGIRRPYGSKNAAAGVGTHPPFAPFHVDICSFCASATKARHREGRGACKLATLL